MVMQVITNVKENENCFQLLDILKRLIQAQKIVVVAGAGISCSSGIPVSVEMKCTFIAASQLAIKDFRSSDGLYRTAGEDMFHINALSCPEKMASWCTTMAKLKLDIVNQSMPSPAHWLIRALDIKQKLLRLYTQNIDGLEDNTGMLEVDSILAKRINSGVVRLHGDINKLWCKACNFRMRWTGEAGHLMKSGLLLPCPDCHKRGRLRFS
jgi:NAD+-dependent protein deacetylase SIR2